MIGLLKKRISLAAILTLAWCGVAGAQAPTPVPVRKLIPFQGRLEDGNGSPLSGSQPMVFRLYTSAAGTDAIWTEPHSAVSVNDGRVNVLLGSIESLEQIEFANQTLYLGITVGGVNDVSQEMVPRHELVPSFFALDAKRAAAATRADAVADGAIRATSLAGGAVTSAAILDGTVTAADLSEDLQSQLSLAGATPFMFEAIVKVVPGQLTPLAPHPQYDQYTNPALTIEETFNARADHKVQIPCFGTASIGADCAGNTESLGIVFDPPRDGIYEVCFETKIACGIDNGHPSANIGLKIVQTTNTDPTITEEPEWAVETEWGVAQGTGFAGYMGFTAPVRVCELFHLTGGKDSKATLRVVYRSTAQGAGSGATLAALAEKVANQDQSWKVGRFRIREIR